ncbi:glycosyltransferase family 2 protein [Caproiciproducens sp. CPB-2]|uniref:glycosyltransferase family 2 protein n=1 Tax=Caproiciproducens sp. CPB-2 TaxID=3030017 RepID=UPI0023DBE61D|nr:glycosyltransferase [Caproiciproducens sp. CPB-2]MDF1494088.1 glycosyltransferase [Caproiciproducens sp. CPB-2]
MSKVSVIMGIYNCETSLSKSIDSIFNQTYTDWEFIICDDGSTDNSYFIAKEYEQRFPDKFRVIKNYNNLGLAASLNNCIKVAQGKYIARMDGDDISMPTRLEKQVEFLTEHPDYDMVGCSIYIFDDNKLWGERTLKEYPTKEDFLWTSPFCHASILYNSDSLRKAGLYHCEKITLRCEDYDLFMRMYALGMKGYNMQQPLYKVYEGQDAYQRRKYRYRIDEMKVRYRGFKNLGLMPKGFLYVMKPLIVGLLPSSFLIKVRRTKKLEEQ